MLNVNILKFMRKILALCVLVSVLNSCKKETDFNLKVDVSNIDVNLSVDRFDVDFYTIKPNEFTNTKKKYPFLFPQQPDSIWVNKINNSDERELYNETQKVYKNIDGLISDLTLLFKHLKYYNPKFKSPRVITMLTDIDYDNRIVYADSLLLVSLDAYLGKEHEFYNDYPKYVKQNNEKDHIIVDVTKSIINRQMFPTRQRNFIG